MCTLQASTGCFSATGLLRLSLSPLNRPYIQFIGLTNPPGTTGYVKDYQGQVKIVGSGGDTSAVGIIRQLALPSEVGIYNPSYYQRRNVRTLRRLPGPPACGI